MREVRIVRDASELAAAAAKEFALRAEQAVRARGTFRVALAGGTTPLATYRLLAEGGEPPYREWIPWELTHVFFGDERQVPPEHPDSNYRMASEALLSKVPIPPQSVHRFHAEGADVDFVATYYERLIRKEFGIGPDEIPRFDLILLGLGKDGHTASLFPGSEVLHEKKRLVAATWVEKVGRYRFTLTPVVLNNAARIVFMVSGPEKAEVLRDVLEGERQPDRLPAQLIEPTNGSVLWLVDREAARSLKQS